MAEIRVRCVGSLALRHLSPSDAKAVVIASMRSATYLRTGDGELYWIVGDDATLHRRAVATAGAAGPWEVGEEIHGDGAGLRLRSGVRLSFREASVWEAPALPAVASLADAARALCAGVRGAWESGADLPWPREAHAARAMASAQRDVVAARVQFDTVGLLRAADRLVGLGEGLTPSGDDFVGGTCFGLRCLDSVSRAPAFDWWAVEQWADAVAERTTAVSACLLADLVRGHGPAALHEVLSETWGAASPAELADRVQRLAAIGGTTGRSLLSGLVAALAPDAVPLSALGEVDPLGALLDRLL